MAAWLTSGRGGAAGALLLLLLPKPSPRPALAECGRGSCEIRGGGTRRTRGDGFVELVSAMSPLLLLLLLLVLIGSVSCWPSFSCIMPAFCPAVRERDAVESDGAGDGRSAYRFADERQCACVSVVSIHVTRLYGCPPQSFGTRLPTGDG